LEAICFALTVTDSKGLRINKLQDLILKGKGPTITTAQVNALNLPSLLLYRCSQSQGVCTVTLCVQVAIDFLQTAPPNLHTPSSYSEPEYRLITKISMYCSLNLYLLFFS
jgi:hypothetical protein